MCVCVCVCVFVCVYVCVRVEDNMIFENDVLCTNIPRISKVTVIHYFFLRPKCNAIGFPRFYIIFDLPCPPFARPLRSCTHF